MDTKKIKLIPTEKDYISSAVIKRIPETAAAQVKLFDGAIAKIMKQLEKTWVKFADKDIWFNTAVSGIFPNLDTFKVSRQNIFFSYVESKFNRSFEGYEGTLMTLVELRASEVHKLHKFDKCLFAYKENGVV